MKLFNIFLKMYGHLYDLITIYKDMRISEDLILSFFYDTLT